MLDEENIALDHIHLYSIRAEISSEVKKKKKKKKRDILGSKKEKKEERKRYPRKYPLPRRCFMSGFCTGSARGEKDLAGQPRCIAGQNLRLELVAVFGGWLKLVARSSG